MTKRKTVPRSDETTSSETSLVRSCPTTKPRIAEIQAGRKGLALSLTEQPGRDFRAFKETQYDLLADTLRRHLDLEKVYEILEAGV